MLGLKICLRQAPPNVPSCLSYWKQYPYYLLLLLMFWRKRCFFVCVILGYIPHVKKLTYYSIKSNWPLTEPFRNPNPNTEVWKEALWCWTSHCWLWCKSAHSNILILLSDYIIYFPCERINVLHIRTFNLTIAKMLCVAQDMGPHIFQTCPSANYFDCKAMSIGARSQSARTYLERCMDKFSDCKLTFVLLAFLPHI